MDPSPEPIPADPASVSDPPLPVPHAWDGFLTGPENALAWASAQALARGEEVGISPLVVHGPSGVGKTRLLEGLVAERVSRWPGSSVAHLAAEAFAALCAEANEVHLGWGEVRARFRGLDLFVLDDVQALERAPLALEELTHTLDALGDVGAAVAVSARVGPGQWSGWPRRLVNRLLGGLVVGIEPPGLLSRRRYLLDRARARGINLAAGAVDALAEAADGYRTLDGWLARLGLAARIERRPLDLGLVEALLAGDGTIAPVDIDEIARAVSARFGVRVRELRSDSRRKAIAGPRHLAMHLARAATGLSFVAIGNYFGRRDPATVRHACRMAAERLAADPALAAAVDTLGRRWRKAPSGDDPANANPFSI
jgi:chromosomal replication initiator protein